MRSYYNLEFSFVSYNISLLLSNPRTIRFCIVYSATFGLVHVLVCLYHREGGFLPFVCTRSRSLSLPWESLAIGLKLCGLCGIVIS